MARLRDSSTQTADPIKTLADIILEKPTVKEDVSGPGLKIVPIDVYAAILAYLNSHTPASPLRHAQALPHPSNACVLPRCRRKLSLPGFTGSQVGKILRDIPVVRGIST